MKKMEVDVLVAGAGTAGIIAGLAAARNGAKTLMIDKQRCVGGVHRRYAGRMGRLQ